MIKLLAIIYGLIVLFTILFQIGLVVGKPWGEYTLGGSHVGSLPQKYRIMPLLSIVVLFLLTMYVFQYVGLISQYISFPSFFKWFIIGFHILSFIMNSITRSKKERALWQPLTAILLITVILIHFI